MAKKQRSEKQKAATRKLVAFNKRKSAPKRSKPSKPPKINKRRSPSKTVAKKRSSPRKSGISSKIPLINNPTFKKAAVGIGTATIGVAVLAAVAPQIAQNPIVKPALAFLGGGIPGVIGQLLAGGGLQGLTSILGGGNGGNGGGGATGGFA